MLSSYICQACKSPFLSTKGHKNRTPKYCSRVCYTKREITPETIIKMSRAKKGKVPWNKGVKMWEGKEHPRGMKGKHSPSGENAKSWKGGKSSPNELQRKSPQYKEWRKAVYERDNYTCVICGKKGGQLQADHIKPFSLFPELRFEESNGRTLCKLCHEKSDSYGSKVFKYTDQVNTVI